MEFQEGERYLKAVSEASASAILYKKEDYQKVFGEKPPPVASLAIVSDSDNIGEGATAYIGFIEIFR